MLPVGFEPLDLGCAEYDRADIGDIFGGPHGRDTRRGASLLRIDGQQVRMGPVGARDPHMELMRKRDIRDEAARAPDQRRVFETLHPLADPRLAARGHPRPARIPAAAAFTASRMLR